MTRKKIVNRVARIIRKHTKYKLPQSHKIAKKILNENHNYNDDEFNYSLEWYPDGIRFYYEWTGRIYVAGKKHERIDWEISKEVYDLKKIYKDL
jgi:hypothetical protein